MRNLEVEQETRPRFDILIFLGEQVVCFVSISENCCTNSHVYSRDPATGEKLKLTALFSASYERATTYCPFCEKDVRGVLTTPAYDLIKDTVAVT